MKREGRLTCGCWRERAITKRMSCAKSSAAESGSHPSFSSNSRQSKTHMSGFDANFSSLWFLCSNCIMASQSTLPPEVLELLQSFRNQFNTTNPMILLQTTTTINTTTTTTTTTTKKETEKELQFGISTGNDVGTAAGSDTRSETTSGREIVADETFNVCRLQPVNNDALVEGMTTERRRNRARRCYHRRARINTTFQQIHLDISHHSINHTQLI